MWWQIFYLELISFLDLTTRTQFVICEGYCDVVVLLLCSSIVVFVCNYDVSILFCINVVTFMLMFTDYICGVSVVTGVYMKYHDCC